MDWKGESTTGSALWAETHSHSLDGAVPGTEGESHLCSSCAGKTWKAPYLSQPGQIALHLCSIQLALDHAVQNKLFNELLVLRPTLPSGVWIQTRCARVQPKATE